MTLTVYYGGHAVHIPEANYVGGSVAKFDYASAKECCLQSLDKFCDFAGVSKDMRYCIILNKDFKLILDNNGIRKEYRSRLLYREMIVYVESLERVEGERDDYVAEGAVVIEEGVEGTAGAEGGEGLRVKGVRMKWIFDVKNVKTEWLRDKYIQKFKSDPKRNMKGFRVDIVNELRVNVSKDQAYRAKRATLKAIEGSPDYQYTRLWDYVEEIRVIILVGFKYGYRPIIGIDECYLKGPHGGILLTTCGVDPNNSLFPIAYAVVNKEYRETWEWFLIILKHDLNILRKDEFTFMSDKQKSLIQALDEVFLGSEHRFCVRHSHNNFKLVGFRGLAYKNALWAAAKACTVGEWKMKMA
ncbi:UNVERIFIED_CONTAM: hypothetical protein Sradi_5094600 [Sesamum radiatum]|uniref:MULE transposase domain-containing protein n=1 Tax=Sesamum radiatum TaxID=300843 RepID=A0AAW2M3S9_SESRA